MQPLRAKTPLPYAPITRNSCCENDACVYVCVCICILVYVECLWTQVPAQQPTGFPTLLGHLASSDLIHPLYVLPVKSDGKGLSNVYRPLSSVPPCDVHVVNLRTMQPVGVTAGKSADPRMALILHRTAVDCSFPLLQSVVSCPSAGGQVILTLFFIVFLLPALWWHFSFYLLQGCCLTCVVLTHGWGITA